MYLFDGVLSIINLNKYLILGKKDLKDCIEYSLINMLKVVLFGSMINIHLYDLDNVIRIKFLI